MLRNTRLCPNCGVADIRPSTIRRRIEWMLQFLCLVPYRCRICLSRFYRFIL